MKENIRYLNSDFKVVPHGTSVGISEDELKTKIIEEANRIGVCTPSKIWTPKDGYKRVNWTDDEIAQYPDEYLCNCLATIMNDSSWFAEDTCYDAYAVAAKTNSVCKDAQRICGYHTVNGVTFLGFILLEDEGDECVCIIYWDGSELHAYIPHWGNEIKFFEDDTEIYPLDIPHSKNYLEKYIDVNSDKFFNCEAMLEEILIAIQTG